MEIHAPSIEPFRVEFSDLPMVAALRKWQTDLLTNCSRLLGVDAKHANTLRRDNVNIEWVQFLAQQANVMVKSYFPTNIQQPLKKKWEAFEVYNMLQRILKAGKPHELGPRVGGISRAGELYLESRLRACCWRKYSSNCTGENGKCEVDHIIPRTPPVGSEAWKLIQDGFNVYQKKNLQLLCQKCNSFKRNKYNKDLEYLGD